MRLQGRGWLGNISEILRQLGFSLYSLGYISQRILAYARAIPLDVPQGWHITFYLSDEIYSGSRPILITVPAQSLAILKIELADRRDGRQWQAHGPALQDAGYLEAPYVVSDLGTGLVKGGALYGIAHHPDLFHLLQPISGFAARFERPAYAAIEAEDPRQKVWTRAPSEPVRRKKRTLYKKAQAAAVEAIDRYDHFCYLWRQRKQAFDLWDTAGPFKDRPRNLAEVLAILEWMKSLGGEPLNQERATLEKARPAYWDYFYRAEKLYQALAQTYPADARQAVRLAWQYQRQAKNSKCYAVQQGLPREAQFYLEYAQAVYPERFAERRARRFADFDAHIRSSSLMEKVNSRVRPFLETCRVRIPVKLATHSAAKVAARSGAKPATGSERTWPPVPRRNWPPVPAETGHLWE